MSLGVLFQMAIVNQDEDSLFQSVSILLFRSPMHAPVLREGIIKLLCQNFNDPIVQMWFMKEHADIHVHTRDIQEQMALYKHKCLTSQKDGGFMEALGAAMMNNVTLKVISLVNFAVLHSFNENQATMLTLRYDTKHEKFYPGQLEIIPACIQNSAYHISKNAAGKCFFSIHFHGQMYNSKCIFDDVNTAAYARAHVHRLLDLPVQESDTMETCDVSPDILESTVEDIFQKIAQQTYEDAARHTPTTTDVASPSEEVNIDEYQRRKMVGDGACFFRGTAFQLYGTQNLHGAVRARIIDMGSFLQDSPDLRNAFIVEHRDIYRKCARIADATERRNAQIKEYKQKMSDVHVYATGFEVHVAALLYNVTIKVCFTDANKIRADTALHLPGGHLVVSARFSGGYYAVSLVRNAVGGGSIKGRYDGVSQRVRRCATPASRCLCLRPRHPARISAEFGCPGSTRRMSCYRAIWGLHRDLVQPAWI
jgi:hypothetical protein